MTWTTRPLTTDRFDDFADVVNKNRRETHCWCVTHRLGQNEINELGDGSREQAMRTLASRQPAPGVITYRDDIPVGWCNIGPRAQMPRLASSSKLKPFDGVPVWSIICVVVRTGYRRQGVTRQLLQGAVEYAAQQGAPAVEAYPVDPQGRMDTTMAFVGTKSMFEHAGFELLGQTQAIAGGLPRLIMRRTL